MKNIVLMFPGVGSQYIGMGKTFYDHFKIVKDTFEEASDTLNINLAELCFSDKEKQLSRLENSQIALVTVSVATYRLYIEKIGLDPSYCIGHSLGEISALCSAGIINFPDALKIVRERGNIINQAASKEEGTMAWVINLHTDIVEAICNNIFKSGKKIFVSAYDTSDQSSISGHSDTVMEVAKLLEKEGAIVYPLKLSGPFHSPLMDHAAEQMKSILQQVNYNPGIFPVIANSNGMPYTDTTSVVKNLYDQLIKPVRWKASIDYLLEKGINTAIEVGPKNVLKFLMEKNTRHIKTYALDNIKDLENIENDFIIREGNYLDILAKCLKIVVSTKNLNENKDTYQKDVIQPYKKIEGLYRELETRGIPPSPNQLRESIKSLDAMLQAKKVFPSERLHQLDQLMEGKVLKFGSEIFNPIKNYETA